MKISQLRHSRAGFTLIELLVGMTIFSIAITAIFLLLNTTMKSVKISRDEIIVANLLREQIELVRNVRDTNLRNFASWDLILSSDSNSNSFTGGYFAIENDFNRSKTEFGDSGISESPVKFSEISEIYIWDEKKFDSDSLKKKFNKSQLCFDSKMRYAHCAENAIDPTSSGTIFAAYTYISPMEYEHNGTKKIIKKDEKSQGFLIDARVIVKDNASYREYDAKTAITDWVR